MGENAILEVSDLCVDFVSTSKIKKVVKDLSFSIKEGEILGLVGTSGSGKTVIANSILNLIYEPGRISKGKINFLGKNILNMNNSELRKIRGKEIALVDQDPYNFLDPLYTIGNQMIETIMSHSKEVSKLKAREKSIELLKVVGIPDPEARMFNYPFQFSGGMLQRVVIAMALSNNSDLIILDDATRSLDVTIQAQILSVLSDLKSKYKTSMLLISASIQVVAQFADRIEILFDGKIVEKGSKIEIINNAVHPFTKKLLAGVPRLKGERLNRLQEINIVHDGDYGGGCDFYKYCDIAQTKCLKKIPSLIEVKKGHFCACHFIE